MSKSEKIKTIDDLLLYLSSGVSMVYLKDKDEQMKLEGFLSTSGFNCISTKWASQELIIVMRDQWPKGTQMAILCVVPEMTVGFNMYLNRVVWMGEVPERTLPDYLYFLGAITRPISSNTVIFHYPGGIPVSKKVEVSDE